METIDILYTFKDEEYLHKLTLFIVKIISTISFIVFLFVMICLKFISTLLMGAIVYLLVGVISFCYIVMEQLKSFPLSIEARPIAYYTNDIGSLLAILNVLTGITRTSAGVMILFYIVTLKFENKTSKAIAITH